ncbi:MAG: hypothetical protein ACYTXC_17015 [Nostoc sp.]
MEIFQCSLKAEFCRGEYSNLVYDLMSVLLEEFPNVKPNALYSLGLGKNPRDRTRLWKYWKIQLIKQLATQVA